MGAIVIPFRGSGGKQRLDSLVPEARRELALAMLGDVLSACVSVAPTLVVTADAAGIELSEELGAQPVDDPGGGQGAAVAAGLAVAEGAPALVVNADLPCAVPDDLRVLAAAAPAGGLSYVEARDGTTNALALSDRRLFAPLYGRGSARRFQERAAALGVTAVAVVIPSLADDIDTLADLERVSLRAGPRTQAALAALGIAA